MRSRELFAAEESTVLAKSLFDPVVVENGESNRCFPDPSRTDESDWLEVFGESDDLLDQFVPPETVPGRRRGKFSQRDTVR